jgi:type 1 fimbriae regulatory protein FimB/type 1 fimbriae regulatory protein FimE
MSISAKRKPTTHREQTLESGTVVALRPSPTRSYLTPDEVDRLMAAARSRGRHGHRDATMILLAYRHGLRVRELVELRWDQVDLKLGRIHIHRLKGSESGVHPLSGVEIRALRRLQREQPGTHVFMSEQKGPMTPRAFFKILGLTAAAIGLDDVHPHLLRHACGYKLVNDGVDTRTIAAYLGHRNLQNTAATPRCRPPGSTACGGIERRVQFA